MTHRYFQRLVATCWGPCWAVSSVPMCLIAGPTRFGKRCCDESRL